MHTVSRKGMPWMLSVVQQVQPRWHQQVHEMPSALCSLPTCLLYVDTKVALLPCVALHTMLYHHHVPLAAAFEGMARSGVPLMSQLQGFEPENLSTAASRRCIRAFDNIVPCTEITH